MMKPRLNTSNKWTQLPKDYHQELAKLFYENYEHRLPQGEFIIESWIYAEELILRLGFLETGRIVQANFEASLDFKPGHQESFKSALDLALDTVEWMLEQWILDAGVVDFPRAWKAYDFEGKKIWLQYSTVNSNLEKEADRLLGFDQSLVTELEKTDALDFAHTEIQSPFDADSEDLEEGDTSFYFDETSDEETSTWQEKHEFSSGISSGSQQIKNSSLGIESSFLNIKNKKNSPLH